VAGLRPTEILILLIFLAVGAVSLIAIALTIYLVNKSNSGKNNQAPVDRAGPNTP